MGNSNCGAPITGGVPGILPTQCNPTGSGDMCVSDWGESYCHAILNTEACGYDGGDCCPSTCEGELCSFTSVSDCLDPNAIENSGLSLIVFDNIATVKGAAPNAQVAILSSNIAEPTTVPDSAEYCAGAELDIAFNLPPEQGFPDTFIADSSGVVVNEVEIIGNFRNRCPLVLQVVELLDDGTCRKSNVAFIQRFLPKKWNASTCSDYGFDWCTSFACGGEPYEMPCCQSPQFWCDVPVDCGVNDNGTPDGNTGPDKCREYWLAPDL